MALFVVFTALHTRLLYGFSDPEVLLLEAGAIVLIAFLVSRAVTNATNSLLERHGLVPRGHAVRLFLNLIIATPAVLALFKLAGLSLESIFIGAGFAGIVLGLASQTVLSNAFAGMLLVFADPFRPGDRVAVITSQYGLLGPSYPHEPLPPAYTGTVQDVGLTYTQLALDSGGLAKVPNAIVIQAMIVLSRGAGIHRVRLTLPASVSVRTVESALTSARGELPPTPTGYPTPRLEVADLSPTAWDGVVVLWTEEPDPGVVRDLVLRAVVPHVLPSGPA